MLRGIRSTAALTAIALMAWAGTAQAAPQPMIGTWRAINPTTTGGATTGGPITVGSGPSNFGAVTTLGRTIYLPAAQFTATKTTTRFFPGFIGVAQLTNSAHTTQPGAHTFRSGSGAVGVAGGNISFCPANGLPPGTPPLQTGNTSCTNFASPGSANRPQRIGINNIPGAPHFGGTFELLRHRVGHAWFVPVAPTSNNPTAVVSNQPNNVLSTLCPPNNPDCAMWSPGLGNYRFVTEFNSLGPNYSALLTPSGRISTLLGSLGTPSGTQPNDFRTGFAFTTGTVSGSDLTPPNNTTATPFFFFTAMGTDNRTTTTGGAVTGNIVLVGGSVAVSSGAGALFNRVVFLSMRVPEPGVGISLLAGVSGLVGLARLRSRS